LTDYKYKQAYDILMDYWDYIPEEEQQIVHEKLEELGL
jgi:hypothetical protein